MDRIAMYHANVIGDRETIDEPTWQDLGMDDLFAKIDRTAGMPGRQILYDQMRTYEADDKVLAERARQHRIFRQDGGLREQLQIIFCKLNKPDAEWLAPLLLNPFPQIPRFAWVLYLLSFSSVACLVGFVFHHALFLPAFGLVLVNIAINLSYGPKVTPYFSGFSQISTLLGISAQLAKIPDAHQLPQLAHFRGAKGLVARLQKRLGWLVIDRRSLPDLLASLFEYLNMCCLFDIVVFLRSVSSLRRHQEDLVGILKAAGSLDASVAVASYIEELPCVAVPKLADDRRIQVKGLRHPLIPSPVGNSLDLPGRSALIAGPNMAGKTAFLRTVGINLILARTLNLCLAEQATFPRAIVRSSIRREDSLADGKSYFFTEISQISEFIRIGDGEGTYLFLIDEIFRGTNTIERIAASAAVLRYLGRRQMILATTHDSELQELLADTFDMYHFSDRVVDGKYSFDYHIRPGTARSRNAIKLLEFSGYPAPIIAEEQESAARMAAAQSRPATSEP